MPIDDIERSKTKEEKGKRYGSLEVIRLTPFTITLSRVASVSGILFVDPSEEDAKGGLRLSDYRRKLKGEEFFDDDE